MSLSASHFIVFRDEISPSSNYYAEFHALHLLLKCTTDQGIKRLKLYSDSSLAINWLQRAGFLHKTHVRPMGKIVLESC